MKVRATCGLAVGVVIGMALHTQSAWGGSWARLTYVEVIGTGSGVCWRSLAVMSESNKVQGICELANDGIEPPTTNAPLHIGSGDELSVNPATPPAVGYNNQNWNGVNIRYGRVLGNIETTTTEPRQGLYRIFSAYTITGAAYYMDGPATSMDAISPPISNCYGVWVVNTVNPAYVIPGFGVVFPTNGHMEADGALTGYGEVGTTVAGGDNQLADSMVSVRWENVTLGTNGYAAVSVGTWLTEEIPLLVGEANNPATNMLRFQAVGISPRPGLPVSPVGWIQVLAIPEPGVAGLLAVVWIVGLGRQVKEQR
ncbi:MAG: hypothetical protein N2595_05765 [bacterium]|nr:hypothetical protein [bacterium]